tara:strand:- start:194 stop:496 length:303 start_codon:yes stop_codon:yes gene_type:complete
LERLERDGVVLEEGVVKAHAWVEAGVGVLLLLMAVGTTYVTLNDKVVVLQSRVHFLETEGVRKDERAYDVMSKLSDSVDRLNINMARLEERSRTAETKSN